MLKDLWNKIKKSRTNEKTPSEPVEQIKSNSIIDTRVWHEERYDNITTQRNLLLLFLMMLLVLCVVAIGVVAYVINAKRFDPFVIQIDDNTGIAKIVNPISSDILSGNESLAQYFIKKYVIARETYNPVDFSKEAKKTVRLLSSNSVYSGYIGYLRNEQTNPSIKYGQKNTTFLTVKSWSKLSDNKYILRFNVNETSGSRQKFSKIAVIDFSYVPMELTEKEKDINPVGFQVRGYRVDEDSS